LQSFGRSRSQGDRLDLYSLDALIDVAAHLDLKQPF